jgi:diguanylate cyclase (GGDEF)-like protein/PAS domain S-box-containing protein
MTVNPSSRPALTTPSAALVALARSPALAAGDLPALFQEVTATTSQLLGVERVAVWFFNPERTQIECENLYVHSTGKWSAGQVLHAADYPNYFRALEENRSLAADDALADPRTCEFAPNYLIPQGITSMLDAPVRLAGKLVGVLCLEHVGSKRTWSIEEEHFASSLGDFLSLGLEASERKRAQADLEMLVSQLEHRVNQRTRELQNTVQSLNQEIRRRQETEESLREAEKKYRSLFEKCIEGIFQTNMYGKLTLANPTLARVLGYLSVDALQAAVTNFPKQLQVDPEADAMLRRRLRRHGVVRGFECRLRRKDGTPVWVSLGIRTVWNLQGDAIRQEGTVVEIQDRKLAEETLRHSEEKYRRLVETAQAGIWTLDNRGRTDYVNSQMAQMLGYAVDEILGKPFTAFLADGNDEALRAALRDGLTRIIERVEVRFARKDKSELWAIVSSNPIIDSVGEISGILLMAVDISDRKFAEEALHKSQYRLRAAYRELETLASLDGLTRIPNRRLFDDRLEEEWRRARRGHSPISLMLIDVDYFKSFNDHYGHISGDDCLRRVAAALADRLRRHEDFLARYGGEEFAVILPDTDHQGALALAEKMRAGVEALAIPHEHSEVSPHVTISVGVAEIRGPAPDLPSRHLVETADRALYDAKHQGRNRVRLVAPVEK